MTDGKLKGHLGGLLFENRSLAQFRRINLASLLHPKVTRRGDKEEEVRCRAKRGVRAGESTQLSANAALASFTLASVDRVLEPRLFILSRDDFSLAFLLSLFLSFFLLFFAFPFLTLSKF